ncbi:hypothetical protein ABZ135_10035 [Streptomyces sp. NPDC006339]|uniref:vWA-MoxR associated conflict system protein n=1 Tax=Streptomyces sp. NPDC006339 TaxID=3156755 RepID=UPI0033AB35C8
MSAPRHVLVIGAQCPELGLLTDLERAARSLHDTLTTPWAGACEKDPAQGPTLLYGPDLTQQRIETAVRRAGRTAAEAGAVLVLAFLGHGMAAGTRLYFMAGDSRAEDPLSAVDVGSLLGGLLDSTGLDGLVTLVDTCHAGNAVPDLKSLAGGIRRGDTRLSLLMGAAADEEAYALRFSTTLVKVLHQGIPDAGETLTAAVVARAVREDGGALGQAVQHVDYDGAQFATGPLWLARNARHAVHRAGSPLGPIGRAELARALRPLNGTGGGDEAGGGAGDAGGDGPSACEAPGAGGETGGGAAVADGALHPHDLDALRGRVEALPAPERQWAQGVLDALRDAARTVDLLAAWPGAALTTTLLRRGLAAVEAAPSAPLPDSTGTDLLRDAVEHLLLRAPRAGRSRTGPLAEFIALLARETEVDPQEPALRAWAKETGAVIDLNDAFARLAERTQEMRLRLVVSLHAAVGDEWPDTLAAWLLDGGTVRHREEFPCPTQDRAGTERTLGGVLRWASGLARTLDTPLRRVEIAAPAPLLAGWRPEETDFGIRLGTRYDVVLRWSDRIQPPDHLWWINDQARDILKAIDQGPGPDGSRVDWLGETDTRRLPELRARLAGTPRTRALALAHRPERLGELMETLLASSPIVLWPDDDPARPAGTPVPAPVRRAVDRHWHLLPTGFCRAYREKWSACSAPDDHAHAADGGGLHHLAGLRTVWDGPEWLEFCAWFDREHTAHAYTGDAYTAPDHTASDHTGHASAAPGPSGLGHAHHDDIEREGFRPEPLPTHGEEPA